MQKRESLVELRNMLSSIESVQKIAPHLPFINSFKEVLEKNNPLNLVTESQDLAKLSAEAMGGLAVWRNFFKDYFFLLLSKNKAMKDLDLNSKQYDQLFSLVPQLMVSFNIYCEKLVELLNQDLSLIAENLTNSLEAAGFILAALPVDVIEQDSYALNVSLIKGNQVIMHKKAIILLQKEPSFKLISSRYDSSTKTLYLVA